MVTIKYVIAAVLLGALNLVACNVAYAQHIPEWLEPTQSESADGALVLRWNMAGSGPVTLFRISEVHSGEWRMNFTDQAELRLFRPDTGEYQFWVQTCWILEDGYPYCGVKSSALEISR